MNAVNVHLSSLVYNCANLECYIQQVYYELCLKVDISEVCWQ